MNFKKDLFPSLFQLNFPAPNIYLYVWPVNSLMWRDKYLPIRDVTHVSIKLKKFYKFLNTSATYKFMIIPISTNNCSEQLLPQNNEFDDFFLIVNQ